ncbi:MAG: response regulator transcription factor [Acidobacteria bacterium]|nr:response regulator transcription factor [Acidobacteriota bacterium]
MALDDRPRVLIVDDEPQITRVLKNALSARGYSIRTASDGIEAIQVINEWPPALVITDLKMPNMDGVKLTRYVRGNSGMPIIVLSVREDERTKVEALDAGADDYVTKPFHMNELLARVRAALRRGTPSGEQESGAIEVGHFHIDLGSHAVRIGSRELKLTPKEFDLLVYFARHAGKVMTHRSVLAGVWGRNSSESPEYLHVFVGHLRKKIEPSESLPRYIVTEPWIGYRFNPGGPGE